MKSILIDDKLHQELKIYCAQNNMSMAILVENAIRQRLSLGSAPATKPMTVFPTKEDVPPVGGYKPPEDFKNVNEVKFNPVPKFKK